MPKKYLEKREEVQKEDPFDATHRQLYFKDEAVDTRKRSEKVKDVFAEAQNDTRDANQVMKFVNAHIQGRVSQLEKAKETQRKFEQELNLFNSDSAFEPEPVKQETVNPDVETALIARELAAMINKYGINKLSRALDQIITK